MNSTRHKWVFFSAFPPFRGGIAKFSVRTLEALRHQMNVDAFTFIKQYPDFLFPGTSQFESSPQTVSTRRIVSTFNPFSYLRSALIFRREKPTVFVTSYWMTFMAPMMVFWTYFLPKKTKKIAIIHNLIPHEKRFFDLFFNRIFLNAYDGFVVLSASVHTDVLALKPNAQIKLIAHPPYEGEVGKMTKHEAQLSLGLDTTKKTLLFFGLIRPYKGLLELIHAFAHLDDTYQLLIAGEVYGDDQMYQDALQQLPHANWFFHNRYLADSEVDIYFAAADVVVLPYTNATQSGIRAMAFAQRRTVLCTNVGGLAEGLEDNGHGFVLQSLSPVSFANQVQSLFNQGDIEKCNAHLAALEMDLEEAWNSFAQGLIALAEEA